VQAFEAPTPLPTRPSDRERERLIETLREDVAAGRLSMDTYADRVDRALIARTRNQLQALRSDLRGGVRGWALGRVEAVSELLGDFIVHWREPRVPRLALPRVQRELILGRARDCDCVLSDETVSRRHAAVRWMDGSWLIRDLGSLNGTRLNGWRVTEEVELVPGDRVSFGEARYRVHRSP
jgi:FHA domain/Domain of unknown function (DUF1707)